MKKVFFAMLAVLLFFSCTTESTEDESALFDNQIEAVDGKKIKRPGSGSGS